MALIDVSDKAKKWIKIGGVVLFVVLGAIFGSDFKGMVCDTAPQAVESK